MPRLRRLRLSRIRLNDTDSDFGEPTEGQTATRERLAPATSARNRFEDHPDLEVQKRSLLSKRGFALADRARSPVGRGLGAFIGSFNAQRALEAERAYREQNSQITRDFVSGVSQIINEDMPDDEFGETTRQALMKYGGEMIAEWGHIPSFKTFATAYTSMVINDLDKVSKMKQEERVRIGKENAPGKIFEANLKGYRDAIAQGKEPTDEQHNAFEQHLNEKAAGKESRNVDEFLSRKAGETQLTADRIRAFSQNSISQFKASLDELGVDLNEKPKPMGVLKNWAKLITGHTKAALKFSGAERIAAFEGMKNDFAASLGRLYGGSGRVAVRVIQMAKDSLPTESDLVNPTFALNKLTQTVWNAENIARSEAKKPLLTPEEKNEIAREIAAAPISELATFSEEQKSTSPAEQTESGKTVIVKIEGQTLELPAENLDEALKRGAVQVG